MATDLFNLKSVEEKRRYLRHRMTKAEGLLWFKLRNRQLGFKFRRQYSIGKYIVDFCCPESSLIIEIDGGVHFYSENELTDSERQKFLEKLGFKVLRYTNLEIIYNIKSVLEDLNKRLNHILPHPSPLLSKEREKRLTI